MPADVIVMTDRPAGEGGASVFGGGFDQGAQMPESPFGGGVTIRNRETLDRQAALVPNLRECGQDRSEINQAPAGIIAGIVCHMHMSMSCQRKLRSDIFLTFCFTASDRSG